MALSNVAYLGPLGDIHCVHEIRMHNELEISQQKFLEFW